MRRLGTCPCENQKGQCHYDEPYTERAEMIAPLGFCIVVFRGKEGCAFQIDTGIVHSQSAFIPDDSFTVFSEAPSKAHHKEECAAKKSNNKKSQRNALSKEEFFLANQEPGETDSHSGNPQRKLGAPLPHFM